MSSGVTPYFRDAFCTIYHGDAREVLPYLSVGAADLIVTDPPYGMAYDSGRGTMGSVHGDDGTVDVHAILAEAIRLLKPLRHIYVFGPFDLAALTVADTTELIWDKGKAGMGNLTIPWGPSHERIAFGVWAKRASHAGYGGLSARLRRGSVISVPKSNNGDGAHDHPTAKPVQLLRILIESSSTFGEVVLDPFMGAGPTLVAARLEGRRGIGIEIEERYCEVAANRLSQGMLDFGEAS